MSAAGSAGALRRARLLGARLCLVAGPETGGPGWLEATRRALSGGGVDLLQLRDKGADDEAFARTAAALLPLARAHGALLLLNDHAALAATLDADGAHVGERDAPPGLARLLLGPERLLGLSTHDAGEVRAARRRPVDYVGLGPCHATGSKELGRTPGGADLVERAAREAGPLPLFAIGGIGPENVGALVRAGARRVAVGAAVLRAPDPAAALRALSRALPSARSTGS